MLKLNLISIVLVFCLNSKIFTQDFECGTSSNGPNREQDICEDYQDLYTPNDPSFRDLFIPNDLTDLKTIRLIFHGFFDSSYVPIIDTNDVQIQVELLNSYFNNYKLNFDYFFIPHNDIVPYMDYHIEQLNLEVMENYNEFPETHLNIYLVDFFTPSSWSYFPWSITNNEWWKLGIFIHKNHFFQENINTGYPLIHEIGHALGLWHVHHGYTEVCTYHQDFDNCIRCEQPCIEMPGLPTSEDCNEYLDPFSCPDSVCYLTGNNLCYSVGDQVGDRCSDTPIIQVQTVDCYEIIGTNECTGQDWNDLYDPPMNDNFMGYGLGLGGNNYACSMHFSPQQAGRMHAWIALLLSGWCSTDNCDIIGCINSEAYNYDETAEIDDGSCYFCEGLNPQGCLYTGCPEGEECVIIDCNPSFCECMEENNTWLCTQDCDGGVCVEIVDSPIGDINYDGAVDVADIVYMVNLILNDLEQPSDDELWAADMNGDGEINVIDIILIVNIILS